MKKIFTLVIAVLATISLSAKQTTVTPGDKTLSTAIGQAAAGDTLVLTTGEYAESAEIPVTVALTFIAAEDEKPVLKLSSGGKNFNFKAPFEMNGLEILSVTNGYVVRAGNADASAMVFKNCFIHGGGGPLIYGSNYAIAKVEIDNCVFDSCSRGEGAVFQSTGGPVGEFIFTNSTVSNMSGSYAIMAQNVNKALVDHCTFYNAGKDPIYIGVSGVTDTCIVKNCIIDSISAGTATTTYKGSVSYCMYNRAAAPFENEGAVTVVKCLAADPLFVDAANGDFTLGNGSPAIGAAEDGTNLGDPRWAKKHEPIVEVEPGDGTLSAAIAAAEDGDKLILSTGAYNETAAIAINKMIAIIGGEDQKPVINMAGQFELNAGGFALANVKVDGTNNTSSYFLSVRGNEAMSIWLDGCEICNYPKYMIDVNTTYHIDSLIINDCYIHDITRSIIYAYTNVSENGLAGCSYFEMTRSTAAYMKGSGSSVASIYIRNNGSDTEGKNAPKINLNQVTMYSVLDPYGIITAETGAQVSVKNSIFDTSKTGKATFTLATKGAVSNCLFNNTDKGADADFTACIEADPQFVDAGNRDFQLKAESPAVTAGDKGQAIGDPRWGVAKPSALMQVAAEKKVNKIMVNGQLVIVRDGEQYNVLGTKF